MRRCRYQRKQPGSSQIVSHRSGRGKKGGKTNSPGSAGFSLSQNNYAHLAPVASSQVSASRSLNGAGYGTAFTDPQHQLQPLRFGKSRFYWTLIHYRCYSHRTRLCSEQKMFLLSEAIWGLISTVFLSAADCHKVPCLCTPAHAWDIAVHHF